jgi:hypothetical protein
MIVNVSRLRTQAVLAVTVIAVPAAAAAQSVRERYETLVARQERVLTLIAETPTDAPQTVKDDVANQARSVVAGFD